MYVSLISHVVAKPENLTLLKRNRNFLYHPDQDAIHSLILITCFCQLCLIAVSLPCDFNSKFHKIFISSIKILSTYLLSPVLIPYIPCTNTQHPSLSGVLHSALPVLSAFLTFTAESGCNFVYGSRLVG